MLNLMLFLLEVSSVSSMEKKRIDFYLRLFPLNPVKLVLL